jgi:hypothetical protein
MADRAGHKSAQAAMHVVSPMKSSREEFGAQVYGLLSIPRWRIIPFISSSFDSSSVGATRRPFHCRLLSCFPFSRSSTSTRQRVNEDVADKEKRGSPSHERAKLC